MILGPDGKPNTYWLEWKAGQHQSDYNNCRFSENKLEFAKNWILKRQPNTNFVDPNNIVDVICKQKLRIITDDDYCNLCQEYTDKVNVKNLIKQEYIWPYEVLTDLHLYSNNDYFTDKFGTQDTYWFKTNHGSGWNLKVNMQQITTLPKYFIQKLNEWLSLNYAYVSGYERQYENITPQIIIEKHKCDEPIDYGFWCVNGNIEGISLTKKLGKNLEIYVAFVDENGKQSPWCIGPKPSLTNLNPSMKSRIDEIIPYVKELSKPFDFVRVDFNYVNGHWLFEEMTFTPCSGILDLNYV